MKKAITALLAAALLGGALTSCSQPRKEETQIKVSLITATSAAAEGRTVGEDYKQAPTGEAEEDDEDSNEPEPSRETRPLSTTPTETSDGKINHGHKVPQNRETERLIRQTSDVILTEADAYKFMTESLKLQDESLHYELTETSDNDPGAFMWYKFTVYKGDFRVDNADFYVICFTDGTLCEGRADFTSCAFYDIKDVIGPRKALEKFLETNKNSMFTDKMTCTEICYMYSGRYQERCPIAYVYRYKGGKVMINAITGELIGHRANIIY